jgi:hypothetical protein
MVPVVSDRILSRIFYLPAQSYNNLPPDERRRYVEHASGVLTHLASYRIWVYGDGVHDTEVHEELIAIARENNLAAMGRPIGDFRISEPILEQAVSARYPDYFTMLDVINRFPDTLPTGQLRYRDGTFMLDNWLGCNQIAIVTDSNPVSPLPAPRRRAALLRKNRSGLPRR